MIFLYSGEYQKMRKMPNPYNEHYLETKQERMHHTLGLKK